MKALVIHTWRGVKESHREAFTQGLSASLMARGVEPVLLDLAPDATLAEAQKELLNYIFDLAPGDVVVWHGNSDPDVMHMTAYAMRILAELSAPPAIEYHFMPLMVLIGVTADAWGEYMKSNLLFSGVVNMFREGIEDEEEIVDRLTEQLEDDEDFTEVKNDCE